MDSCSLMHVVLDRMRALPFFRSLDTDTMEAIAQKARWCSVAGGWIVFEQETASDGLWFLLSGRLIVVRKNSDADEVVGYVRAGEPVGEMSLLTGEQHSASVFALRDSEMLFLQRKEFERILDEHGEFGAALARLSLFRSRKPRTHYQRAAPRVFALIAGSRSVDIDAAARQLSAAVGELGRAAAYLPVADDAPDSFGFDALEAGSDILILAARVADTPWYKFVLRHADRFLVVARRDARPPTPFPMVTAAGERARKFRLVDLVMMQEGEPACATTDWIDALNASRVFNLSGGRFDRLARVVAGRSMGLVLSGGGARAYAHIGVVRSLREQDIAMDFVCGASMGAIIAACVAMGWDDEEIEARIRDAFVESNPLGDHVLPVVALTRGRLVEERLKRHFGDAKIEDLPTPFFCVSSELTKGDVFVHRRGSLRDALRASISLPGILPPVVRGDQLLVDGAVMNNFPADIMADLHRGGTIGVDVARQGSIDAAVFQDPPGFLSWIRHHGLQSAPPIVSLLMRAATARRNHGTPFSEADVQLSPSVPTVELRDWKKFDVAVENGYQAGIDAMTDIKSLFHSTREAI